MASDGGRLRRRGALGHGLHGCALSGRRWRWRLLAAAIAAIGAPGALANPSGAQVVQGTAALRQEGNRLTVTTSNGAVIHWDRFNIGAGDTTRFVQPDAASQVLNRVVGGSPSEILGRLESNGRVFLINPNGVAFGRGAQVDVGALVVSTLKLSNEDFAAGRMRFGGGAADNLAAGQIRNEGAIRTASGGSVYLVAPKVENSGLIHTPEGQVLLAAGHRVSIVNPRAPEVAWEIAAPESAAVNLGEIVARQIVLHGQIVRNAGTLQASSAVVGEDGRIVLRAQRRVEQTPAGRMSASGMDAQGRVRGGEIDVQAGEQVSLQGRAEAAAPGGAGSAAMLASASIGVAAAQNMSAAAGDAVRPSGAGIPAAPASAIAAAPARATAGVSASLSGSRAGSGPAGMPAGDAMAGAVAAAPGTGAADAAGAADGSVAVVADPSSVGHPPSGASAYPGRGPRLPAGESAAAGAADHRPGRPLPVPPIPQPDPRHAIAGGPGGTGGRVRVLAREVALGEGLELDASGPAGGGTVLIGGELQGASAGGPNAQFVFMAPGARITADATANGTGGRVILWADDTARVQGAISARGGAQGGDGGFIETSGRRYLEVTRPADASAAKGRAGEWLLDPYNVEIVEGTGGTLTGGQFAPGGPGAEAQIGNLTIEQALNNGSNVTITTVSAGQEEGNISVNAPITMTATGVVRTLTLKAAADTGGIALNADIKATGSDSGLNLVLDAGKNASFGGQTAGTRLFQLGSGTFDATNVGGKVVVNAAGTSPSITAAHVLFQRLRIEGGSAIINGPATIAGLELAAGTLEQLGSTATLTVTGAFSASGTSAVKGSGLLITKAGSSVDGTLTFSADAVPPKQWENQGTLSGTGTIDMGSALLLNKGAIRPGAVGSAGTLTVKGKLAFDADEGALWLDVGGPGESDQLAMLGDVTLGGALKTDQIPGYTPLDGDRIRAITGSGAVSGRFTDVQMASTLVGFAPTYELGDPVRLVHAGTGVRLFTNALGGRNWDAEDNWRGGQRPQAGDAVLIDSDVSKPVVHGTAAGTTSIGQLTVTSGSALSVTGGSLTVTGTTKLDGHLEVTLDSSAALQGAVDGDHGSLLLGSGRTVLLGGAASLGSVTLGTGATLGGTGSLEVSNSFSRAATATLGTSFTAVTLHQTEGDLSPGPLTVAGPISLSTGSTGRVLVDSVVRATGTSGTITVEADGALEVKAGESGPAGLVAAGNQTLQAASLLVSGSTASTGASLAQASIRSGATQTITITGAAELRGGSQTGRAAVIVAPVQRITVGDSLTLTGGGGSASDARALIGGPQGESTAPSVVDLQITVGKDLVMRAGADGVGARIGHEGGTTANGSVRIEVAGNLSLERTAGAFEQAIIGLREGDGGDLSLKLIATGGNITLDGPVRGGGDVRIVAEKTGDADLGKVTIGSSGQVRSAGSGDALVIAAGSRFTNGGGSTALEAPNGRWLVYSRVDPDYHDRGGLDFGFKHYNQTYSPSASYAGPGSGNGFLYAAAPKLTPSVSGAATKTYDGTTVAPTSGLDASADGAVDGDQVSLSISGASFADRAAGDDKNVVVSVSLDGASSGSASVYGYQLTSSTVTLTGAGEIQARLLTPSFTGIDKVYDGGTAAAVSPSDDRVAGDTLSLDYSAAFVSKAVGSARPITVSGITLSGADAANYTLAAGSASTSATISPRPVSVSGVSAADKVYDGGTVATLGGSPVLVGAIPGDAVSADLSGATGQFADRRVGSAKPVTVSGLQLTGADAGNYQFSGEASTAASITARTVSAVELKAADRVYDGTVAATLSAGSVSGGLGSDDLSLDLAGAQAVFASKLVGINKPVSIIGLKLAGADAGNYALASSGGQTTASISPRPLTLTGVGAADRVYDGSTSATLVAGSPTLQGLITGDAVSVDLSQATARFLDRHAGVAKPVSVSGATLAGGDAGNYELTQTVPAGATISPRTISTAALVVDDRVYDGSTRATLSGGSLQGTIAGDTVALDLAAGEARFADRNVGTGKPVSLTGLKLTGADAGNYALASPSGQATASILARPLQLQFLGLDKVYDGSTAAQVDPTDDRVSGDQLTIDYTAAFVDRHAGAARPIRVDAIALRGADAANYSAPSTGSASATIAVRPLATWRGPAGGGWSNPANWDALPDRGNVAAVSIPASAQVVFDGSLQVSLESLSNAGSLELRGAGLDAVQLANAGRLLVGAGVSVDLVGRAVSGAGTLANEGTLRIAGTTMANRIENSGTVQIAGTNQLGSVLNAGSISQRGGTTTLTGTYRQSAGVTELSAAGAEAGTPPRLVAPAGVRIEGGRLTGEGTIVGPLEITGGTLAPGASPGALAIDGALTLGADSRLAIELGGATPGSYDSVAATGAVGLGGTLEVSSYRGFRPTTTDTFDFLSGATVTGRFSEARSDDPLLLGFNYRNLRVGSAEGFVQLPADRVPLGPAEIAQAQLAGISPTQSSGSVASGGATSSTGPVGSREGGDGASRDAGPGTGSRAAGGGQPPVTGASTAGTTAGAGSGADTGGATQAGEPVVVRRSLLRSLDLPDAAPPEESTRTATGEVRYVRTPRPAVRGPGC